jgi:putative nucleotidyltransferase with HDIG domain
VATLEALVNALEAKDRHLRGHSARVADLATKVAVARGLPEETVDAVRTAARLHDIGKIGIRESILNKQGPLTDEEFAHVKTHTVIGAQILAPLTHLAEVIGFVRSHHERWDGKGYPDGLSALDIPVGARIIGAVEIYDALTTSRPYQETMIPAQAVERMADLVGTGHRPRGTRGAHPRGFAVTERANVPVLLIEDDATMARLVRHLLEMEGYKRNPPRLERGARPRRGRRSGHHPARSPAPRCAGDGSPPSAPEPSRSPVGRHGDRPRQRVARRGGASPGRRGLPDQGSHAARAPVPDPGAGAAESRPSAPRSPTRNRSWCGPSDWPRWASSASPCITELNNPLMAAMAEVEMALGDDALPARHREGLESARSALQRLALRLRQSAEIRRADAIDYLDGLRMIDLKGGAEGPATFRGKAVVWHADQRVRRVLALLLRNAGFSVERVEDAGELAVAAAARGVTLVAVPAGTDGEPPLGGFTPPPSRSYTLVALGADAEHRARAAGADLVLALPFDPATVVGEILGARSPDA